jgi:hypothetical protein
MRYTKLMIINALALSGIYLSIPCKTYRRHAIVLGHNQVLYPKYFLSSRPEEKRVVFKILCHFLYPIANKRETTHDNTQLRPEQYYRCHQEW